MNLSYIYCYILNVCIFMYLYLYAFHCSYPMSGDGMMPFIVQGHRTWNIKEYFIHFYESKKKYLISFFNLFSRLFCYFIQGYLLAN